ncbi:MAG: hypothetical protein AAGI52_04695 [Bacteroidota bacterium]
MTTVSRRLPALFALLVLAPLTACDGGTDEPPEDDLRLFFGVSFERLFSEPSEAEIQSVRNAWASRSPDVSSAAPIGSAMANGATVHVISHQMTEGPGAPLVHFGLVRIPDGVGDDAPILVVHHGGDDGVSLITQGFYQTANASVEEMAEVFPTLFSETVQVIPSYRAEPLAVGVGGLEDVYTSTGSASPWDYDVDDSIALLSAALQFFDDETDEDRIAAIGYSRGANVALLHQVRDPRIDAVTEYYGPTDFFNPNAELLASAILGDLPGVRQLPGATYLLEEVLQPLQGPGETYNADANYDAARRDVIRRSASLFKADMSTVQIHHHTADPVVPYPFSQAFDARTRMVPGSYEFNTYSNTLPSGTSAHSPEGMPESQASTEGWLLQALGVASTREARPALAMAE